MAKLKISVGNDNFREIRSKNNYYIDKTGLIEQLLEDMNNKVTLITRPRRFGKSLNMSMLNCFFDISENSRELFEGLHITENTNLCDNWLNQYPTIFISFKDVKDLTYSGALGLMKDVFAEFCGRHLHWLDSEKINAQDKEDFLRLRSRNVDKEELQSALFVLSKTAYNYYGKKAILLIDEYDVPMAKGNSNGYYREITNVMSVLLGKALKGNEYLEFAVLTGCLRIAKESIFTGLNNLYVNSISDFKFDEYFGFTDKEVDKLLIDANLSDYKPIVKQWFDGYRFGDCGVYCPWDVLYYVSELQIKPGIDPDNYWANTSENEIIKAFLNSGINVSDDFGTLLKGGYIEKAISANITYDVLTKNENNFWSVLYMTGYLTKVPETEFVGILERGGVVKDKKVKLRIPNEEIRELFKDTVQSWFDEKILSDDRTALINAVWNADEEALEYIINEYLYDTISYFDYHENYYHAFIVGLLLGIRGCTVSSNEESGTGRADIIFEDVLRKRAAIFEIKHAKDEDEMPKLCDAALRQIEERQYAKPFKRKKVVKYGIAFYKKSCMVKAVK